MQTLVVILYLFQSLSVGLTLLPALVDAKERCDSIHPLDETGPRPQGDHSIVLGQIQLCLMSRKGEVTNGQNKIPPK